jgi:FeS assembly protein IscX|tara:strand:+ start:165 stop:383 length:219 start_codon:yes stop_codon:yes gene_type:complete
LEKFTWDDAEDIGIALAENHSGVDPLQVRFTDLHQWVIDLEEFGGDPMKSTEGKLERIQMAWLEEFREEQGE